MTSAIRMGLLALLWGSGFLWIKISLNEGLTPGWITFVRCLLGAAVLLALALGAGQRLPRDRGTWGRLAVAALFCNALPFLLFSVGEQTVDSGVAGVLNATTPLWSLLIGLGLGTERPLHAARLGGLVLGFAGVLLIFAPWSADSGLLGGGALALLGASASYAVAFAYMARRLTGRGTAPLTLSAAQLLTAAVLSAPAPAVGGPATVTWAGALAVGVLGVLATGVTFHLNYRMIAEEGPTSAATVGYLLPVVSVALGALVLDEPLTVRVVTGMAVVLVGVGLTRVPVASASGARAGDERPKVGDRR
ncbi:DMT family transporter [Streptomyces sp. WAC08241]|uniref:DMT family transporter n=1 Tax=Streptomyces sp. WAC08241 TaxID=2487421 RepID=UPI000F7B611E|nr:DMT family transporter [Streptomyces sp. WAC08241]RSS41570.1 DMT family transporter [Streptomyces sp. WAC08241]